MNVLELLWGLWMVFYTSMVQQGVRMRNRLNGSPLSRLEGPAGFWARPEECNVVITGATAGLGRAHAAAMAKRGFRVLLLARDLKKGEKVVEEIRRETGSQRLELHQIDLTSLASVRAFALKLKDRGLPVHILVNNAGVANLNHLITPDGMEEMFQVNCAAHFLLTRLLFENLSKAQPPARVVTLSSGVNWAGEVALDKIPLHQPAFTLQTYHNNKLAETAFAVQLQRWLGQQGRPDILSVIAHPGEVGTSISRGLPPLNNFLKLFFQTPEQGAQTQIYLSLERPERLVPAGYYAEMTLDRCNPIARDAALGAALWAKLEKLVGIA